MARLRQLSGRLIAAQAVGWMLAAVVAGYATQPAIAAAQYVPDPAMGAPTITSPDDEEEKTILAGGERSLACTKVTDYDTCATDPNKQDEDSVTTWWEDDGGGTYPDGNIGTSVDWVAPEQGKYVDITAYCDDDHGDDDHLPGGDDATKASDPVTMTVVEVDLDAMMVSHNLANGELDDDDETDPGAFVPINNDDDDYDEDNKADKEQDGSISGESDLLPIKLHAVVPAVADSNYTLTIPSGMKVWQNDDRSGAVESGTTPLLANTDRTVYVEGTSAGSGNIKINWEGTTTISDCDEIKVTVFNWLGPLNVPGHAIYRYTAWGALETSYWSEPDDGMIHSGYETSDMEILWDGGPVVGKAIYIVNGDYYWDLEVNVVEVKIMSGASNKVTYTNPPHQPVVGMAEIWAVEEPKDAMAAEIVVERMQGPSRGQKTHCGMKFIMVGFIQNAMFGRDRGKYNTIQKDRVRDCEDSPYYVDYSSASAMPPFLRTVDGEIIWFEEELVTDEKLSTWDSPHCIAVSEPFTFEGDQLDEARWFMRFQLYLAVRTLETTNDADDVYTQRGHVEWHMDADGDYGAQGNYTPTGQGNGGGNSFTEIADGAAVPVTTGPSANVVGTTSGWHTEAQ